ncbi:hypothetical protein FJZ39_01355 [Candidatus Saccharibacteria bacterium]|nr:hypothetical protein [Candidatus Saccharibacteria bacterium]
MQERRRVHSHAFQRFEAEGASAAEQFADLKSFLSRHPGYTWDVWKIDNTSGVTLRSNEDRVEVRARRVGASYNKQVLTLIYPKRG